MKKSNIKTKGEWFVHFFDKNTLIDHFINNSSSSFFLYYNSSKPLTTKGFEDLGSHFPTLILHNFCCRLIFDLYIYIYKYTHRS